jgi:hypothetical protein
MPHSVGLNPEYPEALTNLGTVLLNVSGGHVLSFSLSSLLSSLPFCVLFFSYSSSLTPLLLLLFSYSSSLTPLLLLLFSYSSSLTALFILLFSNCSFLTALLLLLFSYCSFPPPPFSRFHFPSLLLYLFPSPSPPPPYRWVALTRPLRLCAGPLL